MAGEDLPTIVVLSLFYALTAASIALSVFGIVKQNYRALAWAGAAFLPVALFTTGYPSLRYVGLLTVLAMLAAVQVMLRGKVRLGQLLALPMLFYAVFMTLLVVNNSLASTSG